MGRCAPQTFPNFHSECIAALRARVQAVGVSEDEAGGAKTSGQASRAGFGIEWKYDPVAQALTIQCVASPFYAPCKLIMAQIESWVLACYPSRPRESARAGQNAQNDSRDI